MSRAYNARRKLLRRQNKTRASPAYDAVALGLDKDRGVASAVEPVRTPYVCFVHAAQHVQDQRKG
jgi:hypothetical protein